MAVGFFFMNISKVNIGMDSDKISSVYVVENIMFITLLWIGQRPSP